MYKTRAICKPRHWNLGIGIGIGIGNDITNAIISTSIRPMDPKLGDLGWGDPTHKVTWHISQVVTWQIKKGISPLAQYLWTSTLAGYLLIMNGSHKRLVTLQFCSHMEIWKHYISSTTSSMASKLSRICT